jgi:drug/metabolite transporter (DMT)-like permease
VTTKIGFSIIFAGVVLICLRAANWVDSEMADIVSVLAIVVGALVVAIDGEEADQTTKPNRRKD